MKKKAKAEKTVVHDDTGVWVDRPKKSNPEGLVVNTDAFRKGFVELCAKHLKGVARKYRTLALCQLQDQTSVFSPLTFDEIKRTLKW